MLEPARLLQELGDRVRSRRRERGWSRRQLAEATGISERFLADVETGRANPSVARLCELGASLGLTPAELLGGTAHPSRPTDQLVALLGLRGAGKSSVGQRLADRIGCPLVELDAEIERRSGLDLGQIFELNGEEQFRRAEREALQELLDRPDRPLVVATGGGLVTARETYDLLRARATCVWLKASPEQHWNRVVQQGDTRPMAGDRDQAFDALRRILRDREPLYGLADLTLETTGRSVEDVVDELLERTGLVAVGPVSPGASPEPGHESDPDA